MTFADDIADIWKKVSKEVPDAEKPAQFSRILRLTLQSKKIIAESGRPTVVLPMVRELVRRQYLRIPSEHVPFLEVTVFDLLANPVKKKLQESVSLFTADDVPLVQWFVAHAQKDATLALDVEILEDWLRQNAPAETPASPVDAASADAAVDNPSLDSAAEPASNAADFDATPPEPPAAGDPVTSDRVCES